MKLGRFSDILDIYGAAPESWPESEREAALTLMRSSLPAARLFARARALDRLLAASPLSGHAPGPARLSRLRARILDAAERPAPGWTSRWLGLDVGPSQIWPSVAGLAFATILGFAVGLAGLLQQDTDRDTDETAGWAVSDVALGGP